MAASVGNTVQSYSSGNARKFLCKRLVEAPSIKPLQFVIDGKSSTSSAKCTFIYLT